MLFLEIIVYKFPLGGGVYSQLKAYLIQIINIQVKTSECRFTKNTKI